MPAAGHRTLMNDGRVRNQQAMLALESESKAKVHILDIAEEVLIEAANLQED
jgi:hypothetical protein